MTVNQRATAGQTTDERAIARKYGIRELNYPELNQLKALTEFLGAAVKTGRCAAAIPKTSVVTVLEFLQATTIRQHITKSPSMTPDEYDSLQGPYYIAARIVAKLQGAKKDGEKSATYQTTWVSLRQFIDLLRSMLDPSCTWLRAKALPDNIRQSMAALNDFLLTYTAQRRKGRASS